MDEDDLVKIRVGDKLYYIGKKTIGEKKDGQPIYDIFLLHQFLEADEDLEEAVVKEAPKKEISRLEKAGFFDYRPKLRQYLNN